MVIPHQSDSDPYKLLAAAIIRQACIDYIRGKRNKRFEHYIEGTTRFFYSSWFMALSDLDPDWMIRQLDYLASKMRRGKKYPFLGC